MLADRSASGNLTDQLADEGERMGTGVQSTNFDGLARVDLSERERQPPLCLRWETRGIWKALRTILPCSEEEAAIAIDIVLNAMAGKLETSYSRDRSLYLLADAPSRLHTYRRIVPVIDGMDEKGWILHDRRRPSPRGCGWQSALAPTPELIDAVKAAIAIRGKPLPRKPSSPILLRAADGSILPLPKTRRIERMAGVIDEYNRAIVQADLTGCERACVRRIFNIASDLSRGGRFFAIGGAWQTMPEEERLEILIGGEGVVEIDVRSIHPAMLYEESGLRLEGDAYDVGDWPRDLTKIAMLVLVNAKDMEQAAHSIARKEAMDLYTTPGTEDAEHAARRLIREIRKKHASIQHAFCSDAGARLMRRDSDIAESVLKGMLKAGEVCLPVHDSFIVREGAADVLEEVMRQAVCAAGLHNVELERKGGGKGVRGASDPGVDWERGQNVLTYPSLSPPSSSSSSGDSKSSAVSLGDTRQEESLTEAVVPVAALPVDPQVPLEASRPERSEGRGEPGGPAALAPTQPSCDVSQRRSDVSTAAPPTLADHAPCVDPGSSHPHPPAVRIEAPSFVPASVHLTTAEEPRTAMKPPVTSLHASPVEFGPCMDPGSSYTGTSYVPPLVPCPAGTNRYAHALAALEVDPSRYGRRHTVKLATGGGVDLWQAPSSSVVVVRFTSHQETAVVRRFDAGQGAVAAFKAFASAEGGIAETVYDGPWDPRADLAENCRRHADRRREYKLRLYEGRGDEVNYWLSLRPGVTLREHVGGVERLLAKDGVRLASYPH